MISLNLTQDRDFRIWQELASQTTKTIINTIFFCILSFKLIIKLQFLLKKAKKLLKNVVTNKDLVFSVEIFNSVLDTNKEISKVIKICDKSKNTFLISTFIKMLNELLAVFNQLESIIIKRSFEDDTPMRGFSGSFNDWNKEEENVWEQYL